MEKEFLAKMRRTNKSQEYYIVTVPIEIVRKTNLTAGDIVKMSLKYKVA